MLRRAPLLPRLAALALVMFGLASWATAPRSATPAAAKGSRWTQVGCIQLRAGGPCLDVYRDPSGTDWVCDLCGTTRNPSPGKCNKLTSAQVAAGTWCGGS